MRTKRAAGAIMIRARSAVLKVGMAKCHEESIDRMRAKEVEVDETTVRQPDEPCKCNKVLLKPWWASITDAGNDTTAERLAALRADRAEIDAMWNEALLAHEAA